MSDKRQDDDEDDVREHLHRIQRLRVPDDPMAEAGERGDGLAADDAQEGQDERHPVAGQQRGEGGRKHDADQDLGARRARGMREAQQLRIDRAEALDRVQHGREEAEHGAMRDLRFRPDAEDQHGQRIEHDDRDGEDAREERLEDPCAVAADAHEVSDKRSGDRRQRERDRNLHERHLDVRPGLAGGDDPDEHPQDLDRIGQEQRADPLRHRDGIPKQNDARR